MWLVASTRGERERAGVRVCGHCGSDDDGAGAVKRMNFGGVNGHRRREAEFVVDVVVSGNEMDVAETLASAGHDLLSLGYVRGCVCFTVNDVTETDTRIRIGGLEHVDRPLHAGRARPTKVKIRENKNASHAPAALATK